MTLKLTFYGAAGQVTGSMHMLEAAGARILLDGGLFQGHRAESQALNQNLLFDPRRVDFIVVSHAHIDHIGRLPLLVNQGFHGPIFATPATRDLCAVMLPDAAHIQEKDFETLRRHGKTTPAAEPLYRLVDAIAVQDLIVGLPYHRIHHLRKNLSFEYTDAGHILGSASIDLRITENGGHRLVFSGDIGRSGLPIIKDPEPPTGPIDTLIIESTYANRNHESVSGAEDRLGEVVRRAAARGGKILIPAFALGRIQEMVYALHQLYKAERIPGLPIYIDSPLAVDATQVFRMHPEIFDRRERLMEHAEQLFDFSLVRYIRDVEESKALNRLQGPAIIIAASGMAESGRILHHIKNHGGDHKNIILFVGYQADGTLGRRIEDGAREIKVYGDPVTLNAEVERIEGYSAHADRDELRAWVKALGGPVHRAFCVHGEPESLGAMAQILKEEGVGEVVIPKLGESFDL